MSIRDGKDVGARSGAERQNFQGSEGGEHSLFATAHNSSLWGQVSRPDQGDGTPKSVPSEWNVCSRVPSVGLRVVSKCHTAHYPGPRSNISADVREDLRKKKPFVNTSKAFQYPTPGYQTGPISTLLRPTPFRPPAGGRRFLAKYPETRGRASPSFRPTSAHGGATLVLGFWLTRNGMYRGDRGKRITPATAGVPSCVGAASPEPPVRRSRRVP